MDKIFRFGNGMIKRISTSNKLSALIVSLFIGLVYWISSDAPPYGTPANELSDHYWGLIIDIAHKWRQGVWSFWDRGVGGGTSLFRSGTYPILNPTNAVAWIFNDDQFYLFKIIEPYVFGSFFASLFFMEILKIRKPLAFFGAFAYMGAMVARHAIIMHHPLWVWGCAVFPAMLYFYFKFSTYSNYFRSAVLGIVVAVQFLVGGVPQYLQIVIWAVVLICLDNLFFSKQQSLMGRLKKTALCLALFMVMAVGIGGVQFFPTLGYTLFDANRTAGHVDINNFPLFRSAPGSTSLSRMVTTSFLAAGGASGRGIWSLAILMVGGLLLNFKEYWKVVRQYPAVSLLASSTIIYFIISPICALVAEVIPASSKIFFPLAMVSFRYTAYIIGMTAVMLLCLFLEHCKISSLYSSKETTPLKRGIFWIICGVAFLNFLLPNILKVVNHPQLMPLLEYYPPGNIKSAAIVAVCTGVSLLYFIFRFKHRVLCGLFALCLPFLGFMIMTTSYNWGDKGNQTDPSAYYFDTPEHQYFQSAKDLYYMPYSDDGNAQHHSSMTHNYNLLYGVAGTEGFLCIPSRRFNQFLNTHFSKRHLDEVTISEKYRIQQTPASLVTHFPVDFTTVRRGGRFTLAGVFKRGGRRSL